MVWSTDRKGLFSKTGSLGSTSGRACWNSLQRTHTARAESPHHCQNCQTYNSFWNETLDIHSGSDFHLKANNQYGVFTCSARVQKMHIERERLNPGFGLGESPQRWPQRGGWKISVIWSRGTVCCHQTSEETFALVLTDRYTPKLRLWLKQQTLDASLLFMQPFLSRPLSSR